MPSVANLMKGHFFLAPEAADTYWPAPNARLVVQRFRDQEKRVRNHTSSTVLAASIVLLVELVCMFRMRLWWFSVTQPYLQSDTELGRYVYIDPSK